MNAHWTQLTTTIQCLAQLRQVQGVDADSTVEVVRSELGLYAAIFHGRYGRMAMKFGPEDWYPGAGWVMVEQRAHFALWSANLDE